MMQTAEKVKLESPESLIVARAQAKDKGSRKKKKAGLKRIVRLCPKS